LEQLQNKNLPHKAQKDSETGSPSPNDKKPPAKPSTMAAPRSANSQNSIGNRKRPENAPQGQSRRQQEAPTNVENKDERAKMVVEQIYQKEEGKGQQERKEEFTQVESRKKRYRAAKANAQKHLKQEPKLDHNKQENNSQGSHTPNPVPNPAAVYAASDAKRNGQPVEKPTTDLSKSCKKSANLS